MGNIDWEKVETIVDKVLDLPREEWISFVEKRCEASQEVKSEVTRLLQSISDSEGWLENAETYKKDLIDSFSEESSPSSLTGTEIGSYQITEIIAQGGMGAVYKGERTDGEFEHTVAIKVIKGGVGTAESVRLFNRERNILAGLNHPGIAKLFDGGVLENGSPYLVMEFIEGTPIDQYCDENSLTLNQRISLFKKVLFAVRHAHENLIIHRDLKPDNILINTEGQVKILDFGIAKLLEAENTSVDTDVTQTRILTPKYAAPELIKQHACTTATDLYSLGIILYQLLIGKHPFKIENKSAYETENIILNDDPALPSSRLAGDPESGQLAAKRSSTVRALGKELKGDLNAILLKTIEKNPKKRYRTSNDLLEEVEKYNSGLPVSARQRTARYRLHKFIHRNKAPLSVAVTFLILLAGFTFFHTQRITKERNQAQLEADKAEQVTEFLVSLFGSSNPFLEDREGGTDIRLGSILEFGTEKIDEELENQPDVRAELKNVLGEVYDALNEYDQAEKLLTEAIDIRRNSEQTSNSEMANSIMNLGFIYQEQGKFDEAEELLEESIDFYQKSSAGLEDHNAIAAIARLGNLNWYNKGEYDTADSLLNKALELRRVIHDSGHVHIGNNHNDLATLYHSKGDYETAEPYYRQSIEVYKNMYEEHSSLAVIMGNFSALLKERGDYREAEKFQRESLDMHYKLTGKENRDIAMGTGNLGDILLEQNRLDKADSLLNSSLDLFREIFDSSHTYISRIKLNLGKLHTLRNDYSQAEDIIVETKNEYEELFPEGHPRRSDPLVELGNLYLLQDQSEQAEPYLKKALKIRKAGYGEHNWRTAHAMSLLGINFYQLKKFDQAEPLLIQSYEILDEKRTKDDKYRIQTLEHIIQFYDEWGKPLEKEKFQEKLAIDK